MLPDFSDLVSLHCPKVKYPLIDHNLFMFLFSLVKLNQLSALLCGEVLFKSWFIRISIFSTVQLSR